MSDGLPGEALKVVADYMGQTIRVRDAAAAVLKAADNAPQVRVATPDADEDGGVLVPLVPWPVLEGLRKALG